MMDDKVLIFFIEKFVVLFCFICNSVVKFLKNLVFFFFYVFIVVFFLCIGRVIRDYCICDWNNSLIVAMLSEFRKKNV